SDLLEKAGVDRIHWDVMDGRFVPNLTIGPDVVASCRGWVDVAFEAHLMVDEPSPELLGRFVDAGCGIVMVHAEACRHLHRSLGAVAEAGATPAVVLNPATPPSAVAHVLDLVGLVLVMTVNPGFGGQRYLASMEPKVAEVRALIDASGRDIDLEVDGGIGPATAAAAVAAGADVLVAGSALFNDPDGFESAVERLRAAASSTPRTPASAS
ncbi:MAG: ribulose-phosphate 3-epimerase, partial [Acidimicrobiia bacterium]|nr:ribulose-phosphate 3-epimerase [Acidimicrobiia bacterium]